MDGTGVFEAGGGGGTGVRVFVGKIRIGACVDVVVADGVGVSIFNKVGVNTNVGVLVGCDVRVEKPAPGVRNTSIQTGLVRMLAFKGSTKSIDGLLRYSLFGSSFESILAVSFQRGAKRSAHPLAMIMKMNPNRINNKSRTESRRSFSRFVMRVSIHGKADVYG